MKKKKPLPQVKQTGFITDDLASLMALAEEHKHRFPNMQRLVNASYRLFIAVDGTRPDITAEQSIAFRTFVAALFGFRRCFTDVREQYDPL